MLTADNHDSASEETASNQSLGRAQRKRSFQDALAELLLRHYAEPDSLPTRARQRIEEIFRDNPPDATERLLKAAEYLQIDGSKRHVYAERALAVWHERQERS